jgi:hypothetical protein
MSADEQTVLFRQLDSGDETLIFAFFFLIFFQACLLLSILSDRVLLVNWTEPVKLSHLLATPLAESGPPRNQKKKSEGENSGKTNCESKRDNNQNRGGEGGA